MSALCVCGHRKAQHVERPTSRRLGGGSETACNHGLDDELGVVPGCGCEGYQEPVRSGVRPEFGRDRQRRSSAETAPAWPPLDR